MVQVDFDDNDINTAKAIAKAKARHINVHSPAGVSRKPAIVRSRIIAGKLADAGVASFLESEIQQLNLPIRVREYDRVRKDKFRFPDPWDLWVDRPWGSVDVEVRSSFSYLVRDVTDIIDALSVYGWYTSVNKRSEPRHDLYWQMVYYLCPADQYGKLSKGRGRKPAVPIFEECIKAGAVTGFIVGGAPRRMLESRGVVRRDQDGARYRAISPICAAHDTDQMAETALFRLSKQFCESLAPS